MRGGGDEGRREHPEPPADRYNGQPIPIDMPCAPSRAGLRLAIDARHLVSGMGTYTLQVLRRLQEFDAPFETYLVTRHACESQLSDVRFAKRFADAPIFSWKVHFRVPRVLQGCDLYHATTFDVPIRLRVPYVVTIYDVIYLDRRYAPSAAAWAYGQVTHRRVCRGAEHIVTCSQFSKSQIVERLAVDPDRITVIHGGVDERFQAGDHTAQSAEVRQVLDIPKPYILYVGNLKPHKNVSGLIRGFAVMPGARDFSLLIVGSGRDLERKLRSEVADLGMGDSVRFVQHVDADLLPAVYGGAETTVQPSFVEGFGLPVLESMACGTPVVCSRSSCLPEVAGDAAMYFDPSKPEELAHNLERILSSRSLHNHYRAEGLRRAREFSWKRAALEHYKLYCSLLGLREGETAVSPNALITNH
jgi:glycosyltransferase involved in cell wall biosynthesis